MANPLGEQILACQDVEFVETEVPEWGNITIRIHALNAEGREFWENFSDSDEWKTMGYATMTVLTCTDIEDNPLFTMEDREKLNKKSSKVLRKIFAIANKLSVLTKEDLEEIQRNFTKSQR